MMEPIDRHRRHADALRAAATGPAGVTPAALRAAVLSRAGTGVPLPDPYDALAQQIGEAPHRIDERQVAAVRATTGSDKAAFEIVMAASIGAGLARWEAASRVIDEADDAPA